MASPTRSSLPNPAVPGNLPIPPALPRPPSSGNSLGSSTAAGGSRTAPPQRSLEEESPLLVLDNNTTTTTSPIPDLLDALHNHRDTNRSTDSTINLPQHLERGATGPLPDSNLFYMNRDETSSSRRFHSEGSISTPSSSSLVFTPHNLQPTAPPVYESQQQRRRRRRQRNNSSSSTGPTGFATTSRNSTTSTTSSPPSSPSESHARRSSSTAVTSVSSSSHKMSLRASLDAGMAAVQRWIRSRSNHSGTTVVSEPSSSGRSVTWSNHQRDSSLSEVVSLSRRSAGPRPQHGDEESHNTRSLSHIYHPTIFEEDEDALGRQRALSESDAVRIRDFFRSMRRRRRGNNANSSNTNMQNNSNAARQLSSSAAAALHTTATNPLPSDTVRGTATHLSSLHVPPGDFVFPSSGTASLRERSVTDGGLDSFRYMEPFEMSAPVEIGETSSVSTEHSEGTGGDSERRARARWMQINRRFQLVITAVALLFSLLLFGILICWVVLTSAYVVCFDKRCDVPLKQYFWLVTFQLVLDVFRSDIMRFVFHWDSSSNQPIPTRVIIYNVTYLLYALLVLRLGVRSVFTNGDATCRDTAPELFNASTAFVSLSLAAWATIICGYLLPFFVVAALLTCNGYDPASHQTAVGATQPVFPAAYATTGAPPGTIDLLTELRVEDFPEDYPRECCICMETFGQKTVVETACKHVFHKQCCREWLRQARSCPVCRTDIPSAYQRDRRSSNEGSGSRHSSTAEPSTDASRIPLGPTGRPVVGLWRAFRTQSVSFGASSGSEGRGEGDQ